MKNSLYISHHIFVYPMIYNKGTFMGRSNPEDEVCRQTPRSADPEITQRC